MYKIDVFVTICYMDFQVYVSKQHNMDMGVSTENWEKIGSLDTWIYIHKFKTLGVQKSQCNIGFSPSVSFTASFVKSISLWRTWNSFSILNSFQWSFNIIIWADFDTWWLIYNCSPCFLEIVGLISLWKSSRYGLVFIFSGFSAIFSFLFFNWFPFSLFALLDSWNTN